MVVWILGLEIAKAFFRGRFLNSKIETDSVNHVDSRENNLEPPLEFGTPSSTFPLKGP